MKTSSERLATGVWLIGLAGELDFATAPDLESDLQGPLAEARPRLLLDGSDMTYVSSAGLRVLIRTHQKAAGAGGWLRLFGLQRGVLTVLGQAQLDRVLPVFGTRRDAESAAEAMP